jgi:hypothetical protein
MGIGITIGIETAIRIGEQDKHLLAAAPALRGAGKRTARCRGI